MGSFNLQRSCGRINPVLLNLNKATLKLHWNIGTFMKTLKSMEDSSDSKGNYSVIYRHYYVRY